MVLDIKWPSSCEETENSGKKGREEGKFFPIIFFVTQNQEQKLRCSDAVCKQIKKKKVGGEKEEKKRKKKCKG